MADNILGNRFAGYRTGAWHGLGTVFEEALTPREALEIADADIELTKRQMVYSYGDDAFLSPRYALVRGPVDDETEPVYLGDASEEYVVVQNSDVADILAPIAGEWPVETVGVIRNGATFFMTLDVGRYEVAGEENRQFVLVHTSHDGTSALKVEKVSMRVVCENTLVMASRNASESFSLKHVGDVKAQAEWHVEVMASLRTSLKDMQAEQERMAETVATDAVTAGIITAAYPTPKPPAPAEETTALVNSDQISNELAGKLIAQQKRREHAYQVELKRAEALQLSAGSLFVDEYAATPIGGTAWGVVNAVTEVSNWREGPHADRSVMFGVRRDEGQRAYAKALEYSNA